MHTGSLDPRDYAALDRATFPHRASRTAHRDTEKSDAFHADRDAVAATLERAVAGATDYAAAYVAAEKAARAFSGSWDRATLSDMVDEAVNAAF